MATPPNTLLEPVPGYPVFEANQLLSFRDLNRVTEYLDQQTRLTRVWLTGAGIICGLVPRSNGSSIVISAGCGVTTEGFLIPLDRCTLTHYRPVEIPRGAFLGRETSPDDVIDAFELFEQATDESTALTAAFLVDQVVILLLESKDEKNEACLDDCDEKGTQRALRIRKFLLKHADALAIAEENFNPIIEDGGRRFPGWTVDPSDTAGFNLFTEHYRLSDLYLERFGHTPADAVTETPAQAKLTTVESYEIFLDRYGSIIEAGTKRLTEALKRIHLAFSPIFSRDRPDALPVDLAPLKNEHPLVIQYVYDHLADLILACDEFRSEAFDLMDVCRAQTGWFPQHVFLGAALTPEGELPVPPSTLRTPYVQPPVYNGNQTRVNAARLLFLRLERLIDSFEVPDPTKDQEVRVTPSRWGNAPLSERAIPYYYQPEKDLHHVWSADRHRKARDHRTHSYFRIGAPENPPYDDPLVFDFEGHDFFRIEGHIGLQEGRAFKLIQQLREQYNLPFDIVMLKLAENNDEVEIDCEIAILQAQYTKLRTDLACPLARKFPIGQQPQEVIELLATMPETLDGFDYKDFQAAFEKVVGIVHPEDKIGQCLLGCDKRAFQDLSGLHTKRKEAVAKQDLFHEFAKSHPGMEHKGGVPRGGTFILVYRQHPLTVEERRDRLDRLINRIRDQIDEINAEVVVALDATIAQTSRTVVADFCLPYLCCSDCPPTAYLVARPRPTLVLVPGAFCADDEEKYQFIVDPPGGILTGLGTRQEGMHYYFVPRDTHLPEGFVDVTYSVDGAEAKLKLAILPIPPSTFQLPSRICIDEELVPLLLDEGTLAGGEFATDIDESDPKLGIVETADGVFFDPSAVGFDRDQVEVTVTVTHRVTDPETGCQAESTDRTKVVLVPPAGEFSIEPLPPGLDTFRFQISDIRPAQADPGPFQYVFDWENGHSERPSSEDFVLRIPQRDLPEQEVLTLNLFLRNNHCQGPVFEATSKIIREQEDLDDDVQIPGELLELFQQRHAQNLALITKVGESNEGIGDTKSFRLASALVEAAPDQSIEGLAASYDELVGTVLPVYKRAEDDRKIVYQTLIDTATRVLFDRIVTQPGAQAIRDQASEQLAKIREAGLDLDALFKTWLSSGLKQALDAFDPARIDVVRSLIE